MATWEVLDENHVVKLWDDSPNNIHATVAVATYIGSAILGIIWLFLRPFLVLLVYLYNFFFGVITGTIPHPNRWPEIFVEIGRSIDNRVSVEAFGRWGFWALLAVFSSILLDALLGGIDTYFRHGYGTQYPRPLEGLQRLSSPLSRFFRSTNVVLAGLFVALSVFVVNEVGDLDELLARPISEGWQHWYIAAWYIITGLATRSAIAILGYLYTVYRERGGRSVVYCLIAFSMVMLFTILWASLYSPEFEDNVAGISESSSSWYFLTYLLCLHIFAALRHIASKAASTGRSFSDSLSSTISYYKITLPHLRNLLQGPGKIAVLPKSGSRREPTVLAVKKATAPLVKANSHEGVSRAQRRRSSASTRRQSDPIAPKRGSLRLTPRQGTLDCLTRWQQLSPMITGGKVYLVACVILYIYLLLLFKSAFTDSWSSLPTPSVSMTGRAAVNSDLREHRARGSAARSEGEIGIPSGLHEGSDGIPPFGTAQTVSISKWISGESSTSSSSLSKQEPTSKKTISTASSPSASRKPRHFGLDGQIDDQPAKSDAIPGLSDFYDGYTLPHSDDAPEETVEERIAHGRKKLRAVYGSATENIDDLKHDVNDWVAREEEENLMSPEPPASKVSSETLSSTNTEAVTVFPPTPKSTTNPQAYEWTGFINKGCQYVPFLHLVPGCRSPSSLAEPSKDRGETRGVLDESGSLAPEESHLGSFISKTSGSIITDSSASKSSAPQSSSSRRAKSESSNSSRLSSSSSNSAESQSSKSPESDYSSLKSSVSKSSVSKSSASKSSASSKRAKSESSNSSRLSSLSKSAESKSLKSSESKSSSLKSSASELAKSQSSESRTSASMSSASKSVAKIPGPVTHEWSESETLTSASTSIQLNDFMQNKKDASSDSSPVSGVQAESAVANPDPDSIKPSKKTTKSSSPISSSSGSFSSSSSSRSERSPDDRKSYHKPGSSTSRRKPSVSRWRPSSTSKPSAPNSRDPSSVLRCADCLPLSTKIPCEVCAYTNNKVASVINLVYTVLDAGRRFVSWPSSLPSQSKVGVSNAKVSHDGCGEGSCIKSIRSTFLAILALGFSAMVSQRVGSELKRLFPLRAPLLLQVFLWPAVYWSFLFLTGTLHEGFVGHIQKLWHEQRFFFYFLVLALFRGVKVVVHAVSYYLFTRLNSPPTAPTVTPSDVTVVVRSVGEMADLEATLTSIAANSPERIILVTADLESNAEKARKLYAAIPSDIEVLVMQENKPRSSLVAGAKKVDTSIIAYCSDSAIWPPTFLRSALAPFEVPITGLVGVPTIVQRSVVGGWPGRFLNYLTRVRSSAQDFENTAMNNIDGGVKAISGTTALVRTEIIHSLKFRQEFLDSRSSAEDDTLDAAVSKQAGPADEEAHFISRYMAREGYSTVFHNDPAAAVRTAGTSVGGAEGLLNWTISQARSELRSRLASLYHDGEIWHRYPWTTYTHLRSLLCLPFFYDVLLTLSWKSASGTWCGVLAALVLSKLAAQLPILWHGDAHDARWIIPTLIVQYGVEVYQLYAFLVPRNFVWWWNRIPRETAESQLQAEAEAAAAS